MTLRSQLEPASLSPNWGTGTDSAWESEIEASKAISLKRIADALTGLSGPLNAYGETIGECIQGQHERGLRGIPNP